MLILLRFCLFMLSMSGSVWYLICRFRIRAEFAPALVCAWTSTLLFLAGCLNLLPETALLLFIGGLLLLAVCFFQKYPVSVGRRIWMLYAAGFCAALYFFLFLRKAHFTSYDNFSHWATVVKDMLLENRMPNFQDLFRSLFAVAQYVDFFDIFFGSDCGYGGLPHIARCSRYCYFHSDFLQM